MISLSKYWRIPTLIERCLRRPGDEQAWQEFVRRFHLTIQGSVVNAFNCRAEVRREDGLRLGEELKDHLVQSVYRKLVEDRGRLLKRFRGDQTSSFCGFLVLVSVNVVSTYLGEAETRGNGEGAGRTRSSGGAA